MELSVLHHDHRRSKILAFALGCIFLVFTTVSSASPLTLTQESTGKISLQAHLEGAFQTEENWSDQALSVSSLNFLPLSQANLDQAQDRVAWVRFTIINTTSQTMPFVLMTRNFFQNLQLFEQTESGLRLLRDGSFKELDRQPFKRFGTFSEDLELEPGTHTFYLRSSKKIPRKYQTWYLLDRNTAEDLSLSELVIKSLFIGFFIAILIYVLFQYFEFRDKTFLAYVLYNGAATLNFIFLSGIFRQLFDLPYLAQNQDAIINATGFGAAFLANLFTLSYLNLKDHFPTMRKVLYAMSALQLIYVIGLGLHLHTLFYKSGPLVLLLSSPLIVFAGLLMCLKANRAAYYFTIGWSFVILGSSLRAAELLDLLKENFLTQWGFAMGASLEMFILCYALTEQYRHREKLAKEAIEKLNSALSLTNQRLEKSLQHLKNETLSHRNLVKDLAHQGNNPLHASHLALIHLQKEQSSLTELIKTLLGKEEDMDSETYQCYEVFQKSFTDIQETQHLLASGLSRAGIAIQNIRSLSGIDGYRIESVILSEIWPQILQRLCESHGQAQAERLCLLNSLESLGIAGHSLALTVSLERILGFILRMSTGPVLIAVNPTDDKAPEKGLSWKFDWKGTDVAAPLNELMEEHGYLLGPYGIILRWTPEAQTLCLLAASYPAHSDINGRTEGIRSLDL